MVAAIYAITFLHCRHLTRCPPPEPRSAHSVSTSTSPPSTFTRYTATFAPGGPASPVFGSHSQPCHGQTTFPPAITPCPSGPPRCRQTLSMALISPLTLAMQIVLSPQGNSFASLTLGSSSREATLVNILWILAACVGRTLLSAAVALEVGVDRRNPKAAGKGNRHFLLYA